MIELSHIEGVPLSEESDQATKDWFAGRRVNLSDETIKAYNEAMNPKLPFGYRFRRFLTASNKAGRYAKAVKDFVLLFVPYGNTISTVSEFVSDVIEPEQNNRPMLKKILSIRNFINLKDDNGNFSWQELLYSVIQIGLAFGIAYGATELGIWDQLIQLLNAL